MSEAAMGKVSRRVKIYTKFERFWHWTQMALIMLLLFTGFGMRGLHDKLSFEQMVGLHTMAALGLVALWVFAIFWHLTTGHWKHYLPTANGLWRVMRFYAYDIFRGRHHPYRKAYWRKHNPLQAMAYLALKLFLFPAIWISGLAYLFYDLWRGLDNGAQLLEMVATVHVLAAFAIAAFIIIHLYLLTAGHSFIAHVKPMITGFDEVDLSRAEEAYLEEDKPRDIK